MKEKLTPGIVTKLQPKEKDFHVWDTLESGLCVHVFRSGRKSFAFRYRNPSGRQRVLTIGSFPTVTLADAREKARDARRTVSLGKDPQELKVEHRTADTVGDFAEEYMKRHAMAKKKSWRNDRYMLDYDILPVWKHRAMRDITKRDVRALLDAIVDRGAPVHADHVRALLGTFFRVAVKREVVETNPVRDTERATNAKDHIRRRVLTPEEIRTFWLHTEGMEPILRAVWRLRLLTAQRPQEEVAQMKWSEVDLDAAVWTIPSSKSKNGREHRVPLSAPAVQLLRDIRPDDIEDVPFVFTPYTRAPEVKTGTNFPIENFQPRDLRKTARSLMAEDHVPDVWAEEVLNHKRPGIEAVYNLHHYDREKRQALDHLARRIDAIVNEREGAAVLPFVQRA